jgi:hypothetical protein
VIAHLSWLQLSIDLEIACGKGRPRFAINFFYDYPIRCSISYHPHNRLDYNRFRDCGRVQKVLSIEGVRGFESPWEGLAPLPALTSNPGAGIL